MAVLMPEGAGVLPPIDAEDKPRIRVRLHFGGTFAQDGPRQWRYVGGEVYNESFPLDSKYAEVMKRLNDKFGDTVSFKYLCPGDDIDPDNLVQVQGDDDLQEMCDEYHNALQKSSTPVKTVRIKVFVFRAVIFEREVQELDEELGEDDELMDLPDDGLVGASLSSCDQVECGPNWSDWGEPDEHDITQTLPAEFSSDKEHPLSTADAVAAAAATAALHNISMSVHSVICGRPHIIVSPAPLTSAGAIGGTGGKAPVYGVFQPQQLKPPQRVLGHQAPHPKPALAYGPPGKGNGTVSGGFGIDDNGRDCIDVLRSHFGGVATAPLPAAIAGAIVFGLGEAHFGAFALREMDASPGSSYPEESRGAGCGYMDAEHLEHDGEQLYANVWKVGVASAAVAEETEGESEVQGDHEQTRTHEPLVDGVQLLRQMNQRFPHEDLMTEGSKWMGTMQGERGDLVQVDWRHGRERGLQLGGLEQQQTQQAQERQQQEQQRIIVQQQQTQQAQERQNLNQIHRDVLQPSCLGFFCDDELEDPYGEPYDNVTDPDAATTAAGLICPQQMTNSSIAASGEVGAGNRSSAPSDGAGRSGPRLADMAVRGEQVGGLIGGGGGQLARMPAVADMLPRHISAFGESSRDDNNGAVAAVSGPLLPSRITVFGDGESLHENLCCTGSVTRTGGDGQLGGAAGGLHRLALHGVGGGAAASSPWANLHAASRDAAVGKHVSVALLGLGDELVGGDSRLCITQEFGTKMCSSLMDPGDEVSGLEDATGNVSVGGDVLRLDPRTFLEPLSRTGLGRLGGDGLETLSTDASHNHPLRGVVKKRKSEVSIMAKIGEGAFGEVSQAQVFPYGIVAIKWLKRERFAKYSESFQREAETLAKLNHPNIIRMYGLVMDSPDTHTFASDKSVSGGGAGAAHGPGLGGGGPGGSGGSCGNNNGGPGGSGCGTPTGLIGGIITEFVRNGSLGQYLRSLSGRRLSLRQRAMIALQASLGMAYLHEHSPAVVHFDLKPDNLLVDGEGESMVIKVADFGLSKHKLSNYVSCRDLRGTLPYMASELVTGNGNISEKVDVYSMGVVMWEMYTGDVPFSHLTAHDLLHGLMHGSLHLNLPPECEPEWRSLVETCMDQNPANRPSFPELAMQLQEILRLERQSSNTSSASAAAAAAAAAVLNSDPVVAPAPGPEAPPPIAPAPIGGDGGLVQLPLPGIKVPGGAIAQAQPQVRSPGAGPPMAPPPPLQAPQALLARQQQHLQAAAAAVAAKQQQQAHTLSPQQQQPLPLLAQLQQQHVPQQPFPLQQQFRAVPYVLPQQVMHQPTPVPQPQQAVQPLPAAPLAQPPIPHHLHFLQQFSPALLMQNHNHQQQLQVVQPPQPLPPAPRPTAHLYGHLPLVPLGLYQQPQQPGQLINGLYGLAGGMGAGGGGLPPLVSWADGGV